ncbi:MAG TPA: zinc ribbon domain-containing protein [Mobilitalea sp.]|nr:zinc ribbon domain-containing protein [Mobilitalea sp.]
MSFQTSKWYGRTYHKISPWYASSQICSGCGQKNPKIKLLSIREWECDCRTYNQRDENAARNILMQGLRDFNYIYSVKIKIFSIAET